MAWQDTLAATGFGGAGQITADLAAKAPGYDWTGAINAAHDYAVRTYGGWFTGRSPVSGVERDIIDSAGNLAPGLIAPASVQLASAPAVQVAPAVVSAENATILRQQNPPKKGLLSGGGVLALAAVAAAAYFTGGASLALEGAAPEILAEGAVAGDAFLPGALASGSAAAPIAGDAFLPGALAPSVGLGSVAGVPLAAAPFSLTLADIVSGARTAGSLASSASSVAKAFTPSSPSPGATFSSSPSYSFAALTPGAATILGRSTDVPAGYQLPGVPVAQSGNTVAPPAAPLPFLDTTTGQIAAGVGVVALLAVLFLGMH